MVLTEKAISFHHLENKPWIEYCDNKTLSAISRTDLSFLESEDKENSPSTVTSTVTSTTVTSTVTGPTVTSRPTASSADKLGRLVGNDADYFIVQEPILFPGRSKLEKLKSRRAERLGRTTRPRGELVKSQSTPTLLTAAFRWRHQNKQQSVTDRLTDQSAEEAVEQPNNQRLTLDLLERGATWPTPRRPCHVTKYFWRELDGLLRNCRLSAWRHALRSLMSAVSSEAVKTAVMETLMVAVEDALSVKRLVPRGHLKVTVSCRPSGAHRGTATLTNNTLHVLLRDLLLAFGFEEVDEVMTKSGKGRPKDTMTVNTRELEPAFLESLLLMLYLFREIEFQHLVALCRVTATEGQLLLTVIRTLSRTGSTATIKSSLRSLWPTLSPFFRHVGLLRTRTTRSFVYVHGFGGHHHLHIMHAVLYVLFGTYSPTRRLLLRETCI